MLSPKVRHQDDRTTLKDWNQSVRTLRAHSSVSGTPGLNISEDLGGRILRYEDPQRMRWVFVIGFDGNIVLCKEARPMTGYRRGWQVEGITSAIIRAVPGPNYTKDHFEHFLISGQQPSETDLACRLIGGYIVPDYRLKLVEPPDTAECAECT